MHLQRTAGAGLGLELREQPVDEVKWAMKVIDAMGDGAGAVMIDGKMQDDATFKQCQVVLALARELAERDPDLAKAYQL